jgi:hypothetical protein
MRGVFGVLGLLIVLVVGALLAKKQMGAVTVAAPGISNPASGATPQQQSQHIQKQIVQSVESSLQQARPMPDDK